MYKYEDISARIKKSILDGSYKAGDMLPDQNKLAEDFDTTRITIRKALQTLIIEGIVYSKRGAGTFVRKDFESNITNIESSINKPLGTTHTHPNNKVTSKVLKLDARLPTQDEQESLIISDTDPVYVIERVRYLDGEVFSYEHTIMPTSVIKLTKKVLEGSIYHYLTENGKLVSGFHRVVTAAKATETDIKELHSEPTDPVLVINQLSYLEDGTPFEYSESHFPYQSGKLVADINLENTAN